MSSDPVLPPRRRAPTAQELQDIPWLACLAPAERERAQPALRVSEVLPGDRVCRLGGAMTHWFGVVDGLLKVNADTRLGQQVMFAGLTAGSWFGEGTAIKREAYRYHVEALRRSTVASLPVDTFHWLLDHSLGFNRFLIHQFNERLGQFIATCEVSRLNNPELRVARGLAALCRPESVTGTVLRITQHELASLVGLSRQRVNEALASLAAQGMIRVEYGRVRLLDLPALRSGLFERDAVTASDD